MRMMVTLAFLFLFHQLLTRVAFVSSNGCSENSVIVEDQGSRYDSVNLLVGNSYCQSIIKRDTENAMKSMCGVLNNSVAAVNERNKALNTKIDTMEKKIDNLVQMIINLIGRCPSGYDYYEPDNFCYKFNNACKTWTEARQVCQQEGGDLISLKEGNFNYFRNLVISKAGACNMVWVGTTDAALEGEWNWLNGEKVSSALWQPGQPDNWASKENCGDLAKLTDYRMNDEDCSFKAHSLCQIV